MTKYKALIGIEMHCEISETNTKVFSPARNGAKTSNTDLPNINIRPLDMAFPGTLPTVNIEAVKKALMASIILNCKQPEYLYFERKNYYYPDLPKGYQITQETKPAPIGMFGKIDYECKDETKTAIINNIHLEEDTAIMSHLDNKSLLNYNRAGVPLLELVTDPCFHTADETVAFLETIRSIYQYAGISEADSKKGHIRCDVNVSIMDEDLDETNPENWGTKVEVKGVNSFSAIRDTINYEIERQTELKENGTYDEMQQQTRRWDEETFSTKFMRNKVDVIDYKYFVEPNIPKFKLSESWIKEIASKIPALAPERKEKYVNVYGLPNKDAKTIVKDKSLADFYEECLSEGTDPKLASNWLTGNILGYLNKYDLTINDIYLTPKMLKDIIKMIEDGQISSKQSKDVLIKVIEEEKEPITVVKESGMTQITDEKELMTFINEIMEENPEQIEAYKKQPRLLDYFIGQMMKKTRGKANPSLASKLLKEELDKR
ncbi:MAG: Asp-tRNA(Asn)/Glu-tRNA(Gln) amidotransferase subunit GatB [Bacilli bacterium]|nr:Asp-tRNA(Asn)/Glu-tRNA(Gln) amidotransferase subunit GatB [Bacilli bacterium]